MFPVITTVVIIYVIIIPATPIPIHSLRLAPVRKAPVLTSGMQRRQTRHDDSAMWWHLSKMVSRTVAVSTREKHYLHPGGKKEHWVILMFYKKSQNNPTHLKILDLRDRYIERHRRWISLRFDSKKASAVVFQDTALPQLSKSATDLYSKPVHSYKFSIFHFSRVPGGVYVIWEEGISQFTIQIKIEVLHF